MWNTPVLKNNAPNYKIFLDLPSCMWNLGNSPKTLIWKKFNYKFLFSFVIQNFYARTFSVGIFIFAKSFHIKFTLKNPNEFLINPISLSNPKLLHLAIRPLPALCKPVCFSDAYLPRLVPRLEFRWVRTCCACTWVFVQKPYWPGRTCWCWRRSRVRRRWQIKPKI